jgi:hypothetical protein
MLIKALSGAARARRAGWLGALEVLERVFPRVIFRRPVLCKAQGVLDPDFLGTVDTEGGGGHHGPLFRSMISAVADSPEDLEARYL